MATIEEIKTTPTKTVVNGAAVAQAMRNPKVVSFWEQVREYSEAVKASGKDHSR